MSFNLQNRWSVGTFGKILDDCGKTNKKYILKWKVLKLSLKKINKRFQEFGILLFSIFRKFNYGCSSNSIGYDRRLKS